MTLFYFIITYKVSVAGSIKGETEKALLINFTNGNDIWIPKSVIHSQFNKTLDLKQNFLIDSWLLIKNKILA